MSNSSPAGVKTGNSGYFAAGLTVSPNYNNYIIFICLFTTLPDHLSMFPFLPFLTFPKNDRERRNRDKYLTIQISSETGLPLFKRKNLPTSSLPQKGVSTCVASGKKIKRTNKSTIEECQSNILNNNSCEIFENVQYQHEINFNTTPQIIGTIESVIMRNEIKQNIIDIGNVPLSTDIVDNDKLNDKTNVSLINDECKLLDSKLDTDVLEEYLVKQSPNDGINIINGVNENNLLPATDLHSSFYIDKLNGINLDEITEDEIFGKTNKVPLKFNPSFKESSPVPFEDETIEENEGKRVLLEKENLSMESLKEEEESPLSTSKSEKILIVKENKSIDEAFDELSQKPQGKVVHSPIPPKIIESPKHLTFSKQDITKSTSGKSSPLNKGSRKDNTSPRDNILFKSSERKFSSDRNNSPLLKTSTSHQRIHSTSPRPTSSSQTNLNNVRKISSSGRLSSPNSRNIRQSNDKIERLSHIQSRPMEKLSDIGRTKSTPPNALKQNAMSGPSKISTQVKQSNRNPFAVSDAMLALFGDSSSGGAAACFNKIPPPNPLFNNKNFKRSNILEREQDQPSIFPNTKPIPAPPSSSSTFNFIPDHDKAYEDAKKRSNWKATDSSFSKIPGMPINAEIICGPEHDIQNEDDELSNEGILVVEETSTPTTCRFTSQRETFNKSVVCQPGPDIYSEEDNEDENNIKIGERKTSVNEINTNECIITCEDGLKKAYDYVTNFPEDVKINCCHSKEEGVIDNQKGGQFYEDKSCDNTIYGSRDDINSPQANAIPTSLQYNSNTISQASCSDAVLLQNNDHVTNIIDKNVSHEITLSSGDSKINIEKENNNNPRGSLSHNSSTSGINNDSEEDSLLDKDLKQSSGDVASAKMVKPGDSSSSGSGIPLLIKNGKIINDDSSFIANILIEGSIIKQVGNQFSVPDGCEVIDATNKIIIPAGIDIHTEFSSSTSIDDFSIGTNAAIVGGTATIIDVVIPRNENESLLSAFERTKSLINGKCQCNVALSVMILTWNNVIQKEIESLVKEKGVNSIILNISSCTDDQLFEIMEFSKKLGVILRVSPENKSIIKILERKMLNLGVTGPEGFCQSRPIQLETERISNLGTFSQLSNCPVSIVSLTSSEGCQALQTANINGGILTAEIPIVALAQNGDIYYDKNLALASTFIIRNPLRPGRQHANSLMNALSTLPLAMCVSDHKASKNYDRIVASDFTKMICGIPAVEERLPVLWEKAVCSGVMNYMRFVAVTSTNAAKAFNLYPKKGRIEVGADADITILDTTTKRQITVKNQISLADFNAFEQMNVHCQVVATICGGNVLYEDGKLLNNGNKKQNDMYLSLSPNSPHLFSQVQQRERMAGRVEKVERDEVDSRKSSITSVGGTTNVRGQKINPAFQTSFDNRPISGSGVRNQFESTLNQPLPTNANRSGTKVKNPPGGRSTGFW